jgi:O-antigen ligase
MFHGGLKYGAYAYDPRLRLHYGQAVFILPAVGLLVERFIRRPSAQIAVTIGLLAAAIGVTLTRTLLAGVVGVAVLTAAWTGYRIWSERRSGRRPITRERLAALAAAPVLATLIGIAGGFAAYQVGITVWTPDWAYAPAEGRGPAGAPTDTRPARPSLDRVFEDTENAGFSAQGGGRLTSYALAFADTSQAPLLGHGMGQQARIPWAWGGFRAREAGFQPGVDNAYLTVGLKAGAIGMAVFGAMMLWPLRQSLARRHRRLRTWFVPAWLALLGLTLLQSFAVTGYAPFVIGLLLALPGAHATRRGGR